mmetsp:Transcript_53378/g.162130  ORF Transcript_53378/g.162130 Transcript_53378/m.162130 type:complete len:461 (+) Transcript_53378:1147-2529(+)
MEHLRAHAAHAHLADVKALRNLAHFFQLGPRVPGTRQVDAPISWRRHTALDGCAKLVCAVIAIAAIIVHGVFRTDDSAGVPLAVDFARVSLAAAPAFRRQAARAGLGDATGVQRLPVRPPLARHLGCHGSWAPARRSPQLGAAVGAAEAEAVDPRDGRPRVRVGQLGGEQAGEPSDVDVSVEVIEMDIRRHSGVHELDQSLQQADRSSCRLQVAQVRLTGRHRDRGVLPEHRTDGAHLDRIPQRCASAVVFLRDHLLDVDLFKLHRIPHDGLLRRPVRRSEARAAAILVDETRDVVRKALFAKFVAGAHQQAADALPAIVTVRGVVECEAPAASAQHPSAAEADEREGAHARHVPEDQDLAKVGRLMPQRCVAHGCAHQRGGARCVDELHRPCSLEAECQLHARGQAEPEGRNRPKVWVFCQALVGLKLCADVCDVKGHPVAAKRVEIMPSVMAANVRAF